MIKNKTKRNQDLNFIVNIIIIALINITQKVEIDNIVPFLSRHFDMHQVHYLGLGFKENTVFSKFNTCEKNATTLREI